MSRTGYLNLRITPTRRNRLDLVRGKFGKTTGQRALTDVEAIDFALEFTINQLPERISARRTTPLLRQIKDASHAEKAWYQANTVHKVYIRDIRAGEKRFREDHPAAATRARDTVS